MLIKAHLEVEWRWALPGLGICLDSYVGPQSPYYDCPRWVRLSIILIFLFVQVKITDDRHQSDWERFKQEADE